MFKPHVTVACIVQAQGKFLVVEETIHGKVTWNQPAGHLEANETLVSAAKRELYEETGIHAEPQFFLGLHQWQAPDDTPFLRFAFVIDLPEMLETAPQDDDIDQCRWVSAEENHRLCAIALAAGGRKHSLLSAIAALSSGNPA